MAETNLIESFDLLEKVFISLGRESPFYSYLLLYVTPVPDYKIGTLGLRVSERGFFDLLFNPSKLPTMDFKKIRALVLHQLMHIINLHVLIKAKDAEDQIIWDLAMDAAINQFIPELERYSLPLEMILSGLASPDSEFWFVGPPTGLYNQTTEFYYEYIKDYVKKNGWKKSDEFIKMKEELDSHMHFGDFGMTSEMLENLTRKILKDALKKSQGKIPDRIFDVVTEIVLQTSINWRTAIRRFTGSSILGERYRTTLKPNRRYEDEPGWRREYLAKVALIVDTSGSVIQEEFNDFFSEIDKIARTINSSIWLLEVDEAIQSIFEYKPGMWKNLPLFGRGLTDLQPGIDYAEKELRVEGTIVFTDGYVELPYARRRILFVLSKKHNPDFRKEVLERYGAGAAVVVRN
ncbi:MAG: hypothetical protein PWQ20_801 [Thermotogaceae bacterium]|nr:hypothetical protein [Thermotogaceae bacterium]MDN5337731.1 hypothetical protein [Thermotogaceae bacterium]